MEDLSLFLRTKEEKMPSDPPKVLRVAGLEVCYVAGGVGSRPWEPPSWYQQDENRLLVTGALGLGMEEEVAEALRLAFRVPEVSELVKDLFRSLGSPETLERYLEKWCKRFSMEYPSVLEELAAARITSRDEAPRLEEELLDKVTVFPGSEGVPEEEESREIPGPMEGVTLPAPEGHRKAEESWIAVNRAREIATAQQTERSLGHATECGQRRPEVLRPQHRETPKGYWKTEGGRDQRREAFVFTGRRLPRTEERAEVERAAVDIAKEWLKSQGYKVYEVAAYDVGYDFWCVRGDGRELWVEVKGRSGAFPVSLSEKQWERAKERGESYWLVIVVVGEDEAKHDTRVFVIKDPAKFGFEKREVTTVKYEAQPHQWEEWAEEVSLGGVG